MLVKEIKYFLFLFILLALLMHFSAWVAHPISHIDALSSSSLGSWHPIVITFLVYLLVALLRVIRHLWKRVKT
jgi:polyferredoxin